MMMLGSHLSIAGGMVNALREARRLKFDTVQVFTKNQRQWRVPPLKDEDRDQWLDELRTLGWEDRTVSHASYLANLASPNPDLWERSVALMREEILRCAALSIPWLVFHPGAHMGSTDDDAQDGMQRVADALIRLIDGTPDCPTVLCLETTAGSGTTLGRRFEELATIAHAALKRSPGARDRIGFCFDTCHALAAGYDLTSRQSTERVLGEFDQTLGLDRLLVLHLNDSKGARGSRIDRHEHIGDGHVGTGALEAIVNHPELRDVPKILETPKGETPKGTPWDTINRRRLERLARGGTRRRAAAGSAAGA